MKNIVLAISFLLIACTVNAQHIKLPKPVMDGGKPLMETLADRKSNRDFSDKELSLQQLSDMLWAANGISRPDGRKTAPSARNMQEIDIYVFMPKGIYFYDAKENQLTLKKEGDFRKDAAMQPNMQEAPVLLIFVANYDKMGDMDNDTKMFYGALDCGNVSQNVYLYCSSENLSTVAIGSIHRDAIQKLLDINGRAILGQPVGIAK